MKAQCAGTRSGTTPGGHSGGHRARLQRGFCSKEAAGAQLVDALFPYGTAAQGRVRRRPTVCLVTLCASAAQPLGPER